MDNKIGITPEDLYSRYERRMNRLKKAKEIANSQTLITLIDQCEGNTAIMMQKIEEYSEHLKQSVNLSEPLTEKWKMSVEEYKEAVKNDNIPIELKEEINFRMKTVIETEKEAYLLKSTMISIMSSIFIRTLADILQPESTIVNTENTVKVLNAVTNLFFPKEAVEKIIEVAVELIEADKEKTEAADDVLLTYENYISVSEKWISGIDTYMANL
ncbi:hypothetical protein [Priestia megaterium]|uniref:hypothetical protein n=1 Tax=Priestia megaterium TaxID=1404 RepID=UPI00207A1373|nr:hypothetical protein [Priestia megaterium]USL27985.1 hypothetical protein LIT33_30190 [Priestia megaterium]